MSFTPTAAPNSEFKAQCLAMDLDLSAANGLLVVGTSESGIIVTDWQQVRTGPNEFVWGVTCWAEGCLSRSDSWFIAVNPKP